MDLVWAEAFCAGFAEVFAAALVAVSGFVDLASAAFFAVLLAVLFDALDESGGFLADPLASFVEDLTCSSGGRLRCQRAILQSWSAMTGALIQSRSQTDSYTRNGQ